MGHAMDRLDAGDLDANEGASRADTKLALRIFRLRLGRDKGSAHSRPLANYSASAIFSMSRAKAEKPTVRITAARGSAIPVTSAIE